jgi:threonine dehydrogenase-like Zn-dependent dehydrogenase
MATMRAAFFDGFRSLTVRATPVPEPEPDEVRLRVCVCGICGSDLTVFKTGVLSGPEVILGHEVAAVVDLDPTGEWAEGTRVTPFPSGRGCGECVWCREGRFRYCVNPPADSHGHGGGYAGYMTVPRSNLIPLDDGLDDAAAALAEPFGVALRAVALAEPERGDFAYVQGLGPIGLLSVAGLVASGCRVVGSDPREDRRSLAIEQGAEVVFDPTVDDPFSTVLAFDPRGPRIAFECSGVGEALQQVIDACGPQGVVGILGVPMASPFLLRMFLRELRAFSLQGPTRASMERALALLAERPGIADVVTGTVPLDAALGAFEALVGGGGGGKVLVDPWA